MATISIMANPINRPKIDPSGPAWERYVLPVTTRDPQPMADPTDRAQTAKGDKYGCSFAVLSVPDGASFTGGPLL